MKYLGAFFAVAALVWRRRLAFAACCLAAALPTTLWLIITTGNPVFPFLGTSLWSMPLNHFSLIRTLTLPWNVTFAREYVNHQPPFTPFFIIMLIAMIVRARGVAFIAFAYMIPVRRKLILPSRSWSWWK